MEETKLHFEFPLQTWTYGSLRFLDLRFFGNSGAVASFELLTTVNKLEKPTTATSGHLDIGGPV
jgi:hypothetical protein